MKLKIIAFWFVSLVISTETIFGMQAWQNQLQILSGQLQTLKSALSQLPVMPTSSTDPGVFAEMLKKLTDEQKRGLFNQLEKELIYIENNFEQEVRPYSLVSVQNKLKNFYSLMRELRETLMHNDIILLLSQVGQATPDGMLFAEEQQLLELKRELEDQSKNIIDEELAYEKERGAKLGEVLKEVAEKQKTKEAQDEYLEQMALTEIEDFNPELILLMLRHVFIYEEDARKIGKPINPLIVSLKNRLFQELENQLQRESASFDTFFDTFKKKHLNFVNQMILSLVQSFEQYRNVATQLGKHIPPAIQNFEYKVLQLRGAPPLPTRAPARP